MKIWDSIVSNLLVAKAYAGTRAPDRLEPVDADPRTNTNADAQLAEIFKKATLLLEQIALALAVIYLIYAGVQYITSGGSPDKAKAARAGIINAIIGIVVIVASYAIIRFGVSIGITVNDAVIKSP